MVWGEMEKDVVQGGSDHRVHSLWYKRFNMVGSDLFEEMMAHGARAGFWTPEELHGP